MSTLLKKVKAVDCHTERSCDVLLKDGKIARLAPHIPANSLDGDTRIIDGDGLVLMPSFVDLHVHFRDPGQTQKEDIATGSRAAVHGGYTTVHLMPNTNPVCSTMETVRYVEDKGKDIGLCNVLQSVSITKNFDGVTTSHLENIDDSVLWLTDDGNGISSTQTMLDAMEIATRRGFGLMLHEEDRLLTPINSYLAEDSHTYRDSRLALTTGCPTHFCHVSTIDSIRFIREAKEMGAPVTCEVTPHHLYLTDENPGRVAPPLRGEEHRQALIRAVKDGVVDAIATDHAPHTPEDKAAGMNGFTGLDLGFAASYTVLVLKNKLPLTQLSRLLSYQPARLLQMERGELKEGAIADLVLLDLDTPFTVREDSILSKSKNTPLLGETLYGTVLCTWKEGELVYEKQ